MSSDVARGIIEPTWNAPARVRAVCTTRQGGVSEGPYASLNLAEHVGDDAAHVAANRALLRTALGLPSEPLWLSQVHGCDVHLPDAAAPYPAQAGPCAADAAVASQPGQVCVVMTADCLPVLLCDAQGCAVAAVHAGWRGLLEGVIEAAVAHLRVRLGLASAGPIMAWLGPAIGPDAFEVGAEVLDAFCARDAGAAAAFRPGAGARFFADLYLLARQRLQAAGVRDISGGDYCTLSDPERFFSYRRDGRTGRMASMIWIAPLADAG